MKTTIKLKLRLLGKGTNEGVLVLHVTYRRLTSTYTTEIKLNDDEWSEEKQTILLDEVASSKRIGELKKQNRQLNKIRKEVSRIINNHSLHGNYSASRIITDLRNSEKFSGIRSYMEKKMSEFRNVGKFGTEHTYRNSLTSFMRFTGYREMKFEQLNPLILYKFEQYLLNRGNSLNTISCYIRGLRAGYNSAIKEGIVKPKIENPFSKVFTGNARTEKRAIEKTDIKKINQLRIPNPKKDLNLTKSLFLFSFFTRGMSYKDIVSLKKEDIKEKTIRYKRQKTGQELEIQLLPCMQSIINEFKENTQGSPYVFPVLKSEKDQELSWKQYQTGLSKYNRHLKRISTLAGLDKNLTGYVARHSWATIARKEGVPLSVISRGMGHESEKTTRIYIGKLDNSDIDIANKKILGDFRKKQE